MIQVGGKQAGLLNFSMAECPYKTTEIWQYGTQVNNQHVFYKSFLLPR